MARGRRVRKKRHPLSGAIYEDLGDGRVRVEKQGISGIFRARDGRWLEGDLTYADPHMIGWVGGRELPARRGAPERERNPEPVHD
jgi:hypothetical protein